MPLSSVVPALLSRKEEEYCGFQGVAAGSACSKKNHAHHIIVRKKQPKQKSIRDGLLK